MADEMLNRIEKQLEGNSLALSAVAEVLQKMDAKMSEQHEVALAKQEEAEADADRQTLIKEIASEVASIIKTDAGMEVSGNPRAAKSSGKNAANADDSETAASPTTAIKDQQATIQAMDDKEEVDKGMYVKAEDVEKIKEALANGDKDEAIEKFAALAPLLGGALAGSVGQQLLNADDAEDDDMKEEKDDDMEVEEEKSVQKQMALLRKQVADYEINMKKSIQIESEDRLKKMGFREENGLQAPQRINPLGVDGTEVIQKGNADVDTIDQLAGLSYKELRDLQTNIEAGKTEGVPRELLGN